MFEYESGIRIIELNPKIKDLDELEIGKILNLELGKAIIETGNMRQPQGWEIISHSLLLLGNHLIVSFVERREKKQKCT
jgi:hypothetical protein